MIGTLLTGVVSLLSRIFPINTKRRYLLANVLSKYINTTAYSLDSPVPEDKDIYPDFVISGWAVDYKGINRVEVYCDGVLLGNALYGTRRMDVARSYPLCKDNANSGFQYLTTNIKSGNHVFELRIINNSGKITPRTLSVNVKPYKNIISKEKDNNCLRWSEKIGTHFVYKPRVAVIIDYLGDTSAETTLHSISKQIYKFSKVIVISRHDDIPPGSVVNTEITHIAPSDFSLIGKILDNTDCEFIVPLQAGDVLEPDALFEFVKELNISPADLIYTDHFEGDGHGNDKLICKPEWSVDLLLATDFIGRAYCIKSSYFDFEKLLLGYSFDETRFSSLLRIASKSGVVCHIDNVVGTIEKNAEFNIDSRYKLINEYLFDQSIDAELCFSEQNNAFYVRRKLNSFPKVTIVIPTLYHNKELIRRCVSSICKKSAYENVNLVIINTGNDHSIEADMIDIVQSKLAITVIQFSEIFNWSKVNNIGAANSDGNYLLFLNDDVEVIAEGWIEAMLEQAQREDVCAVGAKLLYGNGKIQHAGIRLVDHGGGGRHAFLNYSPESLEYFSYLNIVRECSAVTGACMMIARDKFFELGGFDELLRVEGNDTDFCLRGRAKGYKVIWTPFALLYHHEQSTRKEWCVTEDTQRFWEQWGTVLRAGDKFYNEKLNTETENITITNRPVFIEHTEPELPISSNLSYDHYSAIPAHHIAKILVIKLDHIGDVILSFPAIKMLKEKYPSSSITMLVAEWIKPLVEILGVVDSVITFNAYHKESEKGLREISEIEEKELQWLLHSNKFDLAIDMRRHGDTRKFLKLSGAKYTVGYSTGDDEDWMTVSLGVPAEVQNQPRQNTKPHIVAQLCQLVTAIDKDSKPGIIPRPILKINRSIISETLKNEYSERFIVGIHACAGSAIRQWPIESFAILAEKILSYGAVIFLFGGQDDRTLNNNLVNRIKVDGDIIDLSGKATIPELADILSLCDVFVGNNSGPSHIAAMLGVPTLSIFSGQVLPHEWQPFGEKVLTVRMKMPCSPCYFATQNESYYGLKCLRLLSPEKVHEALLKLVAISGLSDKLRKLNNSSL